MKRFGIILALVMAGCAGAQVASPSLTVPVEETTASAPEMSQPEELVSEQDEESPQPYSQEGSCQSFHDNELVGQPYVMGFHYCIYAEGKDVITGCMLDTDLHRSYCVNADGMPEVGVQWYEHPGVTDGEMVIPDEDEPQGVSQVATIHGEIVPVDGGRVMMYLISFGDGTHSRCVVGGPTVQYCRVDW